MILKALTESDRAAVRARLLNKIEVGNTDECWEWSGATNSNGYGVMRIGGRKDGKLFLSHRIMYFLNHPDADAGSHVLHSCDNPRCCNPSHLSIGSHADNMDEMVARDRQAKGLGNGQAKLNPDVVRRIRASGATDRELAQEFGVVHQVINKARNRKTWVHV